MKIGYARVSTTDQNLDVQERDLRGAGCEKIFMEKESGAKSDRPELAAAVAFARDGDSIVVSKMDRLSRRVIDLLTTVEELESRNVGLIVLNVGGGQFDTRGPAGKMLLTVLGMAAEFERSMLRERQRGGIDYAKTTNRHMGRPQLDFDTIISIKAFAQGGMRIEDIARRVEVSKYAARKWITKIPTYKTAKSGDKMVQIPLDDADIAELEKFAVCEAE